MSTGCLSLDERTREALLRMMEDAAAIRRYVERAGGEWIHDEMAFDAVCKRLEDIVEHVHTSRVALEFQQQHPEIPWRSIKGFRDVAVHAYADVDRELAPPSVARPAPATPVGWAGATLVQPLPKPEVTLVDQHGGTF